MVISSISLLIHMSLENTVSFGSIKLVIIPHIILLVSTFVISYYFEKSIYSPYGVFAVFYILTIIIPILVSNQVEGVIALSKIEILNGSRIYLIILIIVSFLYAMFFKPKQSYQLNSLLFNGKIKKYSTILFWLGLLGLLIHLASLSSYQGFSIIKFITSPADIYFDSRQGGRNWAILFREFTALFTITVFIRMGQNISRKEKLKLPGIFWSFFFILLNGFLSGRKTDFIWIFIGIISIYGYVYKKITRKLFLLLSVILLVSTIFLFMWRGAFTSIQDAPHVFNQYNHSFNYTAKTVTQLQPDSKYFKEASIDLVTYLMPRAVWPEKPVLQGLTRRYLQFTLISINRPELSAYPTMGLSEAWLSLGYIGIALSGICMGAILVWSRKQLANPKSLRNLIFGAYLYGTIYFFLRTGFLNVYIYNLVFTYLILVIIEQLIKKGRINKFSFNARRDLALTSSPTINYEDYYE